MKQLKDLEEIMYFDEQGINRFINQLENGMPDSLTMERGKSHESSGALKPSFDLGVIFSKLLPGLKIESDFNRKHAGSQKTIAIYNQTSEQRYIYLINHLTVSGKLGRSLHKGWLQALTHEVSTFCLVDAKFYVESVASGDWVTEANLRKTLVLTDTDRQFRMGMGYRNLVEIRDDGIHPTSHLVSRLRHGANLRIFGKIESSKYIKPYHVSWL